MPRKKETLTSKTLKSARQHHQAGRLKQAESLYRKILQRNPRQSDPLYRLGLLALQTGHYQKAIEFMKQAINIDSTNPDYFYHFGLAATVLNNIEMAFQAFRQAIHLQPDYAAAYNDLGVLFERSNNLDAAITNYHDAVKYKPDYSDAYFNLARVYQASGNTDAAICNYEKALEHNPNDAAAYNNLGNLFKEKGETARAIEEYRKSVQIEPNSGVYSNIGRALRDIGDREGAIAAFEMALSLNPKDGEAFYELALSKHYHEYSEDMHTMEELLLEQDNRDGQMYLSFGLGKAFEDIKRYDTAFSYYERGNKIKRDTYDYSIENVRLFFNAIKEIFDEDFFKKREEFGLNDYSQIFIVGMPRSGTTLVEQILASHSQVRGAGEVIDLKEVIFGDAALTVRSFSELVPRFDKYDIEQFGNKYLETIEPFQKGSKYVTNKLPLNFMYIGMIRLIFPQAKIIHCRRDPIATCLSCYKQLFTTGHLYAYDLQELANYYLLYQDLMSHWHATLPGHIYDNHYEALIADQKKATEKLLAFCGLPWDEQCLNFHRTKRSVETASCVQVRQPIYNSSVALWKHYEKHLRPLIQTLGIGHDTMNYS